MNNTQTSRIAMFSFYSVLISAVCGFLFLGIMYLPFAAVASTILIVACFVFSGISFVSSMTAMLVLVIHRNQLDGWRYALPAFILSVPILLFWGCLEIHSRNRIEHALKNSGRPNLKNIGESLLSYEKEYGTFPDPNTWCDTLMQFDSSLTKDSFRHPRYKELGLGECNFCFNSNLGNKAIEGSNTDTVLVFEANGSWNLNGSDQVLQSRYSKDGYIYMMFLNRTIRNYWYSEDAIRDCSGGTLSKRKPRWEP